MGEWKEQQLCELVDISSSKRIFYKEYVPIGIPFYRSKEVIEKHNGKAISTELHISIEKYDDIKKKFGVPVEGDMLLTSVGTLGIPYIVQKDEKFYFKDGNLTWFRNFNENFLNQFLYYWIISPVGKGELDMVSIGSTQQALTIIGLKSIDINLPPLPEQKAIASVLSSLDDKIDLLHRQNKTLEAIAETLFRQWFVEEAQEDWETVILGNILTTIESGSRPKGGIDPDLKTGISSIGAENINGLGKYNHGSTKYITTEYFEKMKRGIVQDYDILIYKDGAYVGKKSMFGHGFPFNKCAINEHVFILRTQNISLQLFLYFALEQDELALLNANSAQPGLNQTSMKSFELLLPKSELIEIFGKTIMPLIDKIFFNGNQIRTLEKLRDTLLPKLMSGEVGVEMEKSNA